MSSALLLPCCNSEKITYHFREGDAELKWGQPSRRASEVAGGDAGTVSEAHRWLSSQLP